MFTYSDAWHNVTIQVHVHLQQCMAQHKYPVTCSPTVMGGTTLTSSYMFTYINVLRMAQHRHPVTRMFTYSDVWHNIIIQ